MAQEIVETSCRRSCQNCTSNEHTENWQREIDTMDWESPALGQGFPGTVMEPETVFVECSGR